MRTPATSLPLDVELLEDRTLQDAKPSFVIPTALLGDSLVQQWNQEHVLLETGTQRVSALQGDVGRLTIELTTDRAQAALAGDGLTKTAPTLTAAIADRDRLQLELKNLNTSLQSLTTLRTTHQQLVTKLTQEIQTLTATLETQKRELQQLQAAPVVTTTLATLQQQKTAAEQDRTRLQAEHRAIAADTTLTPTIKNQRLEAKNNEIIAKSKVIEALITKINQPQTQSVVPVTSPASQKTIDAKKLAITGTQAAIDKKKIDLGAAKKVVDADTVQIGTVTATVKTKESQVSAANTVVATQTAQRDSYAQAMAAAIAEQNKDELAMTAAKTDLVAANLFVQNETAKTGVLDAAMADFLTHYQATMLVPKEKIETTLLPLEIVLKSEGSNTWSLEAKNLRDGDSVYLWRRVYKWDGQRNNIVWGAFAGVAAEGTEYFTAIGDWPHSSPDTTAEMRVTDAKGTVLATKTVDFMNKAGASFTINEVQKQVTTIVKTGAASALAQQKETLTGPPTVTSTLSNGKVHLRMQGLPARTTAILRGPNIDYRDIVMPMGDGEITPAFLSPELFVLGKYTIQFTRDGQLLDTPKTLGPGSTLSVEGMQRSDTLSDSAETITAAPRMQIVATREGVTFRYQFLPAGSNLEIAETDHGSLIPNPSRSEVPLQGTQGSISLKGQFPDCWYRFLVTGPDGKLTGLEWNIYIPGGNTGLVISNPVISKTQSTTVPLSSTAPMPWIGELDHQTFSGGASYNWAGQMNDQARAITGLDIPGDQIVGAFQTIVKERMGFIPLSLLPAVPQALRTVIERPDIFAQLYDAHTQMSATQAADRNGIATNETALWKKHDEVQLKNSTTPGPVSEEAFQKTKQTILQANAGNADGGAQTLINYIYSVQRTTTMDQVATWTGKSVSTLQALGVKLGTETASNTDLTNAEAGLKTDTQLSGMWVNLPAMHVTVGTGLLFAKEFGSSDAYRYTLNVDTPVMLSGKALSGRYTAEIRDASGKVISTIQPPQVFGTGSSLKTAAISQLLMAGTYTVTVRRLVSPGEATWGKMPADFHFEAQANPTSLNSIKGTVSLSNKQTAVTLRRFMLDANGNQITTEPKTGKEIGIQNNVPTWVVIHGRTSNSEGRAIEDLAKSLLARGEQVLLMDWREGAHDISNFPGAEKIDLSDADWTRPSGKWLGEQLMGLNINPNNIRLTGWSHGTFEAFFAAETIHNNSSQKVGALVALDSPRDVPDIPLYPWDNRIRASEIDFSKYATSSLAFISSPYGSEDRTQSAEWSYIIESQVDLSNSTKHEFAVTTFAELIRRNDSDFSLDKFLKDQSPTAGTANTYPGGNEGLIRTLVVTEVDPKTGKKEWLKALPLLLNIKDPATNQEIHQLLTY